MEIIKMGKIKREQQFRKAVQIKCLCCGTIFICDQDEIHSEVTGHGEADDYVYCPLCNIKLYKRGLDCTWATIFKPVY